MKRSTLKRALKLALVLAICLSITSGFFGGFASAAQFPFPDALLDYPAGVTVDADPESPTGYYVTFVYIDDEASTVRLAGDLTLRDATNTSDSTRYQPEDWQTGRYHVGGVEFTREMTFVGNHKFILRMPMHAGGLSYWYRVDSTDEGYTNKRVYDPASGHPRPADETTTYRVLNNDVLDACYVPYAEVQNDPILEKRAHYELPIEDEAKRGTVTYVPYETMFGDTYNLGVYLPAGYDAEREEPYKVMYLAHGIFGDETDWMVPGNAPNIVDHLIDEGKLEPTVLITMGNHFTPASRAGQKPGYNANNAVNNLVNNILPFVEANYNVSTEKTGRGYGGFSMGGMTGATLLNNYADKFGYFAFCSGTSNFQYAQIAEKAGAFVPFIFMGNGLFEGSLNSLNNNRDRFIAAGIPAATYQVNGAHDMMTAGQLFTKFAEDYLWKNDVIKEGVSVTADPESPTGYTGTFVYKSETADAVRVAGDLTLFNVNEGTTGNTRYQPEEWVPGCYHVGGVEFLRDMEKIGDYWVASFPLHAGGLSYWYRVDDESKGWSNKRIYDPASGHPRPEDESTSYRVLNNDVLDACYVPYDEKMEADDLKEAAAYELPIANANQRGTVTYVQYKNMFDEDYNLGIYLPAGYDAERAKPYKVIYLAHGMFGDETDWMVPGNAPNILDHLIANGELEPTVMVTMGNQFTPSTRPGALPGYNQNNAVKNLVENILPFVEENYTVSTEKYGRAYGGFSMGGMTGATLLNSEYSDRFGFFAFCSGSGRFQYEQIAERAGDKAPFVFMGNGCFEGSLDSLNATRDAFIEAGIPAATAQVNGNHNMMTAGKLFTNFAKNYLWKIPVVSPDSVRALTDMGWWGQRVIGVVLEFEDEIDASNLSLSDFAVRDTKFNPYFDSGNMNDPSWMDDQKVVDFFTTDDPARLLDEERPEAAGKYLVVMVEPSFTGGTKISVSGYMLANPDQPTEITLKDEIYNTDGEMIADLGTYKLYGAEEGESIYVVNRTVDKFIHGFVEQPTVGQPFPYDYRLPDNLEEGKLYPLVVFLNGNGQGYLPRIDNVQGQLICDGTNAFFFNEQEEPCPEDCIFLAPQNVRSGGNSVQAQQVIELIEALCEELPIDTDRIYGYSLSAGSGLGWAALAEHPGVFTAFVQTSQMNNNARQAQAIAESMTPMWLFQGKYDHLFGSAGVVQSYNRIVNAYKEMGLSDKEIDDLIKITLVEDPDFEPQGPGLSRYTGRTANPWVDENKMGPRIDRHASLVPAFRNFGAADWLFQQSKKNNRGFMEVEADSVIRGDDKSVTFDFVVKKLNGVSAMQGGVTLANDRFAITDITTADEDATLTKLIAADGQSADFILFKLPAFEDVFRYEAVSVTVTLKDGEEPIDLEELTALMDDLKVSLEGAWVDSEIVVPAATTTIHVAPDNLGDVDGDGDVDLTDLTLAMSYFGAKESDRNWFADYIFYSDVNADGIIDMEDLCMISDLILLAANAA